MPSASQSPFFLPIHLTGLYDGKAAEPLLGLLTRGMLILCGMAFIMHSAALTDMSALDLVKAFLAAPFAGPDSWVRFWDEVWNAPFGWAFLAAAFLLFTYQVRRHMAELCGRLAANMSPNDLFPHLAKRAVQVTSLPAFLFLFIVLGGCALWMSLIDPRDTAITRWIRLPGIALGVLAGAMICGGAMACALAEGRSGGNAFSRLFSLMGAAKGRFARSAVYTMPRLLGLGLLQTVHCSLCLGVSYVATASASIYLQALQPMEQPIISFGRGALLVILGVIGIKWVHGMAARAHDGFVQFLSWVAYGGIGWTCFVLPFTGHQLNTESLDNWGRAMDGLLGESGFFAGGYVLPALMALLMMLIILSTLGQVLFVLPLAFGVATFFTLRKEVEGVDYEPHTYTAAPVPAGSARLLFAAGGTSAFSALKPPRGWAQLALLGLRPQLLVAAFLAGAALVLAGHPATLWFVLPVFVVVLCAVVAGPLGSEVDMGFGTLAALPFRMAGVVLRAGFDITRTAALLVAVGMLVLIPKVGVWIWAVVYLSLIVGAAFLTQLILLWLPGAFLLLPVMALEGRSGVGRVIATVRAYATGAPWAFLSATVTGLVFSFIPAGMAMLAAGVGDHLRATESERWYDGLARVFGGTTRAGLTTWSFCWSAVVVGLLLMAVAMALTNAFLTMRPLVSDQGD